MESIGYYWDFFLAIEADRLLVLWKRVGILGSYVAWSSTLQVLACWHAVEYLRPWRRRQPKWRPQLGLDFFWLAFNTVLAYALFGDALVKTGLLIFHHALFRITGITDLMIVRLDGIPTWAGLLLLFVIKDLLGWAGHWLLHRSDLLWQFHRVHHSATQLDIWNAQRFHVGERIFWSFFLYVPLAVIGFPPDHLLITGIVSSALSNFTHANVRVPLGPLKYLINNPQIHIWHHARARDMKRNVNYGDALCVWDYLFGTAYLPEEDDALELGFDGIEEYPTSIPGQLVAPFVGIFQQLRKKLSGAFA